MDRNEFTYYAFYYYSILGTILAITIVAGAVVRTGVEIYKEIRGAWEETKKSK